jgi:hypothetical protein
MFIVSTYNIYDGEEIIHHEFDSVVDAIQDYKTLLILSTDGTSAPMLYLSTGEIIYGLGEEVEGF